jgi:hypothetical protein
MSVLNISRASRNVPEPQAVNVDPARTNAVCIPNAMPTVAMPAVPDVAIIRSADDVVLMNDPIDADVLVDVNVPSDVDVFVDVNRFIDVNGFAGVAALVVCLRVCRSRDSQPKHSKGGKNNGNFP